VLEAEHDEYGVPVEGLKLSDQEILTAAKIVPQGDVVSYFDVGSFVHTH
jgi:hypothetical protein